MSWPGKEIGVRFSSLLDSLEVIERPVGHGRHQLGYEALYKLWSLLAFILLMEAKTEVYRREAHYQSILNQYAVVLCVPRGGLYCLG